MVECFQDERWLESPLGVHWECQHRCVTLQRFVDPTNVAADMNRVGRAIYKNLARRVQTTVWVQDHPCWVLALDLTHSESWVVCCDGSSTHNHGVDQSAKSV